MLRSTRFLARSMLPMSRSLTGVRNMSTKPYIDQMLFLSENTCLSLSCINSMWKTEYSKAFKKKYLSLDNNGLEYGDKIVVLKRNDGWYNWWAEKDDSKGYNRMCNLIKNGYHDQIQVEQEHPQFIPMQTFVEDIRKPKPDFGPNPDPTPDPTPNPKPKKNSNSFNIPRFKIN